MTTERFEMHIIVDIDITKEDLDNGHSGTVKHFEYTVPKDTQAPRNVDAITTLAHVQAEVMVQSRKEDIPIKDWIKDIIKEHVTFMHTVLMARLHQKEKEATEAKKLTQSNVKHLPSKISH